MITEEPRLILSALMMTCGWVMYISRVRKVLGAQHSSDIAVSTEVLRFICDPRTNLSNPALAILLTDF